jgi:hypothetical protein
MEVSMKGTLKMDRNMDMDNIYGQMGVNMLELGYLIILEGMALINGLMEDHLKDAGKTTKCMVRECIIGLMVENMMAFILMISKKDMVYIHGQTEGVMKDIGFKVNNMEKVNLQVQKEKAE